MTAFFDFFGFFFFLYSFYFFSLFFFGLFFFFGCLKELFLGAEDVSGSDVAEIRTETKTSQVL